MTQTTTTLELIGTIEHNESAERVAICFDALALNLVSIDAQGNVEDCEHNVGTADQARVDFGLLWGADSWEPAAYSGWVEYLNQVENSDDVYAVQAAGSVAGLALDFAPALYYAEADGFRGYFRIEAAQAAARHGIVWVTRRVDYGYGGREVAAVQDADGNWQAR